MNLFPENIDPVRDLKPKRALGIDASNDYMITCTDPYGFWNISRERGQIPEELKGSYSSPARAREAVTSMLARAKAPAKDKKDIFTEKK